MLATSQTYDSLVKFECSSDTVGLKYIASDDCPLGYLHTLLAPNLTLVQGI